MAKSFIAGPFAFKKQREENLAHLFVGRFGTELGHCKRVRRFCQLVDLIVVRKLKSDFHLVHRRHAGSTKPPAPMHHKALERPLNVVVARFLAKRSVGQIGGALVQRICNLFVHGRMVQRGFSFFNSHFPTLAKLSCVLRVHGKNFASARTGK